jgi:hypothetical protein
MIRWLGLSLIVVFSIGLASPAEAQMAADPYGWDASTGGDLLYRIEPTGGFGLETMQSPFAGMVVMDRFGMVHAAPIAQSPQHVPAPQRRTRKGQAVMSRRVSRDEYQLPTGSLNWAGASNVVFYSPALRYETYGGGYGRGPYGSMDCGMMYHGMSLGY